MVRPAGPASSATPAGGASEWVPARRTLPKLRSAVERCEGCDLFQEAAHGVMGRGPVPCSLMLVGEQPGDKEDRAGEPFVGPSGALLDKALQAAGIAREDVFVTNVVKHFRFSGTRGKQRIHKSPSRWHVAACQPWLIAELELARPAGVVLLGATAGAAVHGASFRLRPNRGAVKPWPMELPPHPPGWVLATAHPSAVLRSRHRDEDFDALVADLTRARESLPEA